MAALSDVFVRVKPDTTGLPAELKADVEAAAGRVEAKINVKASVQLDRSILAAEIGKMREELKRTGDVTLRPKIRAAAQDLTKVEQDITGAMKPAQAAFTAAIVGGAALAAPLAGAAIVGGLGLGGIGAGIALALQDSATKNAVTGLGNTIKDQLVDAATPFRAALVGSVSTLGGSIQAIGPELKAAFSSLAPVMEELAGGLGGALQAAAPGFVQGIQAASEVLSTFASELPSLGQTVGAFFTMLNEHSGDLKAGITFAMNLLEGAIADVSNIMGGLLTIAGPVFDAFNNGGHATQTLVSALIAGYGAFKTFGIAAAVLPPIIESVSAALVFMGAAEDIATEPIIGIATAAATVAAAVLLFHEANKKLITSTGESAGAVSDFNAATQPTPPVLQDIGERAETAARLMKEFGLSAAQATADVDAAKGVFETAAETQLDYLDAVQAVTDKSKELGQAVTDSAAAETQANNQVRDSREAAADSDYSLAAAHRAVTSTHTAYNKALVDEKTAEKGMAVARKEAIQNLKDLKQAMTDAKNASADTALSVEEAQAQLDALKGLDPTSLLYREAQQKVVDAQAGHADAVNNSAKATDKYADAQKKGINGSDAVVAQNKKIADAHQAVIDKKQAEKDADHALVDSEHANRNAHDAVTTALKAQTAAIAKNRAAKAEQADFDAKVPNIKTVGGREKQRLLDREAEAKTKANPPVAPSITRTPTGLSSTGEQWVNPVALENLKNSTATPTPNPKPPIPLPPVNGPKSAPSTKTPQPTPQPAPVPHASGTRGNAVSFKIDTTSLKTSTSTWDKFTAGLHTAFDTNFGGKVTGFLGKGVTDAFGSLGKNNLPTLNTFTKDANDTTHTNFFDKVGGFFTSTVPSLFGGLGATNLPTLSTFAKDSNTNFNTGFTTPFSGIFKNTVPALFTGLSKDVDGVWNGTGGIVPTTTAGNTAVGAIIGQAIAALNVVGKPFGVSVAALDTPGAGGAGQPQGSKPKPVVKGAGGPIEGPGGPTDDVIPAMLSNGEFVHQASAVDYYGKDFMHALNDKKLPKFASGGEAQAAKTVKSYGLRGIKPWVSEAADLIGRMFGIKTVGGYSKTGSVANSDHPKGLALDFMTNNLGKPTVSNPIGTKLADYVWDNQKGLGITYEIWNRHNRTVARYKQGWRNYSGPSAHTDHVHVSFADHAGSGALTGGQGPISGIGDTGTIAGAAAAIAPFQAKLAKLNFLGQIGSGFLGKLADSLGGGSALDSGAAAGYAAVPAGVSQKYAAALLSKYGWGPDQFGPLKTMWNYESGWNVHAANSIGAYGIPQALPGSKMASVGKDWRDNYKTQVQWGLGYIKGRYGDPAKAWAHWEKEAGGPSLPHKAQGWYDQGGWLTDDETLVHRDTKRPEAVLTPDESANYKKMAQNGAGIDETRLARLIGVAVVQALHSGPTGIVNLDGDKVGHLLLAPVAEQLRL